MARSEEWMAEFGDQLPNDPDTLLLVLDGSIEICPCCGGLSAYCWDDCTGYDEFEDGIIPGGFVPAKDMIAHIGTASGLGEWECGHCKRMLVDADSPLNHPCYTHEDD